MSRVITYSSSNGQWIDLTPAQEQMLIEACVWPTDRTGEEMCKVEHGLHDGGPTYTDAELRAKYIDAAA